MKTIIKIILALSISMFTTSGINNGIIENSNIENSTVLASSNTIEEIEVVPEIVYDGLTMDELAAKIERNLNSTISGYGYVFASKSIELGLDPYLAVAIMLHETGCKWNCSSLMQKCNNVGGIKGKPSCGGGAYRSYPTLDEGVNAYLELLYNNYYAKGYTTPELLQPRYAGSTTWASKINYYINEIKNS